MKWINLFYIPMYPLALVVLYFINPDRAHIAILNTPILAFVLALAPIVVIGLFHSLSLFLYSADMHLEGTRDDKRQ